MQITTVGWFSDNTVQAIYKEKCKCRENKKGLRIKCSNHNVFFKSLHHLACISLFFI